MASQCVLIHICCELVPQETDSDLMQAILGKGRSSTIVCRNKGPQQIPEGTPELRLPVSDVLI